MTDVTVVIGIDNRGAVTGIRQVGDAAEKATKQAGGLGESLGRIATIATGITAANIAEKAFGKLTDYMGNAVKAASNLEQSVGGVQSVFGSASQTIFEFGEAAAGAVGLSKNQVNELSAATGAFLKNFGMSADEAAGQTIELTKRAADMAATFGGEVADAMSAIQAGLRGQQDPLERYGVSLTAARVESHALAMTGKTLARELSDQEKMAARLDLVMRQTADAAGQFGRESETAAGKAARLKAEQENQAAELGEKLLPAQLALTQAQLQFARYVETDIIPAVVALQRGYEALRKKIMAAKAASQGDWGHGLPGLPGLPDWLDKAIDAGMSQGVNPIGTALKGLSQFGQDDAAGGGGALGGGSAGLNLGAGLTAALSELGKAADAAAESTKELRKGIDYLKDGMIDMSEAATLGLSAMEAGAVEAFDALEAASRDANSRAFDFQKSLTKLAVTFRENEQAAAKMVRTMIQNAMDLTRRAGASLFGRPTQEQAALELQLAEREMGRLDLQGEIGPRIDDLRRQLDNMGDGVDENVVQLRKQKAEADAYLSNLRALGTATEEELQWAQTQSDSIARVVADEEARGNMRKNAVEAEIAQLEERLAQFDRQTEAIQKQMETMAAQNRIAELQIQAADKTLLTQGELTEKASELRDMTLEQSEAMRALTDKMGDDLIPEMDLAREAHANLTKSLTVLSDEAVREDLIPAFDALAEKSRIAALAMDETAEKVEEAGKRLGDFFSSAFSSVGKGGIGAALDSLTGRGGALSKVFSGLQNFDGGGQVQGPLGQPLLAVVHGGETVRTPEQERARTAGGGITINVHVAGSIRSDKELAGVIARELRQGGFRGLAFGT